jgi:ABC-2 type transport system ATP-binding protein
VFESAVRTTGLTKRYGERFAVDHVDLRLPSGGLIGFVGANGAGKTTTLRMLLGLVRPTSGTGWVLGEPLEHPERYLNRVGAMIEGPAFYPSLSGRRNLDVLARLAGVDGDAVDAALGLVGLDERAGDPVRTYSLGMRQRLGIAAALLVDPQLLILDEPTNGLDPAGTMEMRVLLRRLADDGMTVFVSSHLLHEIQTICDHIVLIAEGRLRFSGTVDELLSGRGTQLLAVPEHGRDLARLADVCRLAGHAPAVLADDRLLVTADATWAPELNRAAMGAGITLARLEIKRPSLEEVYFDVTSAPQLQVVA